MDACGTARNIEIVKLDGLCLGRKEGSGGKNAGKVWNYKISSSYGIYDGASLIGSLEEENMAKVHLQFQQCIGQYLLDLPIQMLW